MYTHILIATDGSELAEKALEQGLSLAKALGARVTVATVTEPWTAVAPGDMAIGFPVEEYEQGAAANAAKILAAAHAAAERTGASCQTLHVKDRFPAEGVIDAAKEQNCDLIVMSSHGRRGLSRLLLGSQAAKVVTASPVSVLVCR